MATRPSAVLEPTVSLEVSRARFYEDVQNRNGVSRTEAEEVLAVLDQLIGANSSRLVYMPHNPKLDKKATVVKFGLSATGPVFWAAFPGPVYGAKLVVLPQPDENLEPVRAALRAVFNDIDRGFWKRAHPDDMQPAIEFRYLRFPRDFDRATKAMAEALASL